MYSTRNDAVGELHISKSDESEQCTNVTALSSATGPSLSLSEQLQIGSNDDEYDYRSRTMLTGRYTDLTMNGA